MQIWPNSGPLLEAVPTAAATAGPGRRRLRGAATSRHWNEASCQHEAGGLARRIGIELAWGSRGESREPRVEWRAPPAQGRTRAGGRAEGRQVVADGRFAAEPARRQAAPWSRKWLRAASAEVVGEPEPKPRRRRFVGICIALETGHFLSAAGSGPLRVGRKEGRRVGSPALVQRWRPLSHRLSPWPAGRPSAEGAPIEVREWPPLLDSAPRARATQSHWGPAERPPSRSLVVACAGQRGAQAASRSLQWSGRSVPPLARASGVECDGRAGGAPAPAPAKVPTASGALNSALRARLSAAAADSWRQTRKRRGRAGETNGQPVAPPPLPPRWRSSSRTSSLRRQRRRQSVCPSASPPRTAPRARLSVRLSHFFRRSLLFQLVPPPPPPPPPPLLPSLSPPNAHTNQPQATNARSLCKVISLLLLLLLLIDYLFGSLIIIIIISRANNSC